MANLWEIDERLMNYQMEFDPNTGEWVNEDEWDAIQMDKTEKIKNTIYLSLLCLLWFFVLGNLTLN